MINRQEVVKLQLMFDAGCSPALYQDQGKTYDFLDLTKTLCPHCKADHLKKHGYYTRSLITIDFDDEIIIRRYCCPECKKTVSLLPSFCHPKRTYGILAIFRLLTEFYIKMRTVCLAVTSFLLATEIECSRQLLQHWRRRIEQNLNSLVMAVTDIYELQAPPVTERSKVKEKVRQLLSSIKSPQDDSLKIFKRTRTTYLTPFPI
jgi:hypothetical protein